jgi:hypothetical protein
MKFAHLALMLFFTAIVMADIPHYNKKQIQEKIDGTKVMYGATIRIKAAAFPY